MRFIYTKRRKERHDGFSRYLSFSRFYSRIGFYAKNGTLFYSELLLKKRVFLIVSIIIRYKMVTVNYFYFLEITFTRLRARIRVFATEFELTRRDINRIKPKDRQKLRKRFMPPALRQTAAIVHFYAMNAYACPSCRKKRASVD